MPRLDHVNTLGIFPWGIWTNRILAHFSQSVCFHFWQLLKFLLVLVNRVVECQVDGVCCLSCLVIVNQHLIGVLLLKLSECSLVERGCNDGLEDIVDGWSALYNSLEFGK